MQVNQETAAAILAATITANPEQAVHLQGPPGVGKTDLVFQAAKAAGIPSDRVLLFRASMRDPVDLIGIPTTKAGVTKFNPPEELHRFKEGSGPGLIILDELPQSSPAMQNALSGLLLDLELGGLKFDKQVARISTGNRVQDKAGASRLLTQVGNRLLVLEVEVELQSWVKWAFSAGIPAEVIAFLQFRPGLLHDFDPNRTSNPTPRSWAMLSRLPQLPDAAYLAAASGLVGDGAAAEWCAARKILAKLPSIAGILAGDATPPLGDVVVAYAVSAALARQCDQRNFDTAMAYMVKAAQPEIQAMFVSLASQRDDIVMEGSAFLEWAIENSELIV